MITIVFLKFPFLTLLNKNKNKLLDLSFYANYAFLAQVYIYMRP